MKKVAWLLILLGGCIEPYMPPEIKPAEALLVIDGHIDYATKSIITLSRTQNLTDTEEPIKVTNATVLLENEQGLKYTLTEEGDGIYSLAPLSVLPIKHRLLVRTPDAKEYASAFVEIKNSAGIDSISWDLTDDLGVSISVSTHDTENSTGHYRWKYEETWIYTPAYFSLFEYNDASKSIDYRSDDLFHCWQTQSSTDLLINSTSRLSENQISKFPLVSLEQRDPRLRYEYSILVKQYAITEDAYAYWQELKKTTEDLGTLFSPMPSQVAGNYNCTTDANEKVLGFFSIGVSTEKRIFIHSGQLPAPESYNLPAENCFIRRLELSDVSTFNSSAYIITTSISQGATIIAYEYTTIPCADCRAAGGTNIKPAYWP